MSKSSFSKFPLLKFVCICILINASLQYYEDESLLNKKLSNFKSANFRLPRRYDGGRGNKMISSSPNFQLPDTILPIHYDLQIEPAVVEPHPIKGYVSIEIKILKSTSTVVLNIIGLEIEDCTLKKNFKNISNFRSTLREGSKMVQRQRDIQVVDIYHEYNYETVSITAGEALQVGHLYTLHISYIGFIRRDMMGFYKSSYMDKNNKEKFMFVTQFQMSDARSAFPCFDQPNYKSIFTVTICRPPNMTALSNMPLKSTTKRPDQDGVYCDVFEPTVKIPTYLLAFAVTEYKPKKCNSSSVPMQIYGPQHDHEDYEYSCHMATEILSFFENFTGLPYALPKIDLLSVPQIMAYGMENYGLLTFREKLLKVNKNDPDVAEQEFRSLKIIAHELAHQWFGNLVTTSSWADIWLFEGLATYFGYVAADKVRPDLQMMRWFYLEAQHVALEYDATTMTRPLTDSNIDLSDLISVFDEISYWKSSSIIRMLVGLLTHKTFQKGVSTFLTDNAFGNGGETELWRRLTKAGHEDETLPLNMSVQNIMKSWLVHKGYPIITFQIKNNTLMATQESIFKSDNISEEFSKLWFVRLEVHQCATNVSKKSNYWMNSLSINTTLIPHNLYIVNPQHEGYYRVNYDEKNWINIIEKLTTNHTYFDNINKLQLLDDVFTLANKNKVNYSIAMDMLTLMEVDLSPYILHIALPHMSKLISTYDYNQLYGSLSRYFSAILEPHFWKAALTNKNIMSMTQFESITGDFMVYEFCKINAGCIEKAQRIFLHYLSTNESSLEPVIQEKVLCIGIAEGGTQEWSSLWKMFETESLIGGLPLGRALACARQRWMLSRYFNKLFKSKVPSPVVLEILEAMAKNPFGIDFVWDKIRESWQYKDYIHRSSFTKIREELLRRIVPHFRNHQQYNDVLSFLSKIKINFRKFAEPLEILRQRVQFHDDNEDELLSWERKKYNL